MRDRSRTKAGFRLGLMIVAGLALLAGSAWWLTDRNARRAELIPPVAMAVAPAASAPAPGMPVAPSPPVVHAPAEPGPGPIERLNDVIHPENAPTTEADPPLVPDGVSWGHAKGLQRTADDLHLKASAAVVADASTGQILFRKNEDAVLPIASLSKLMTAMVVLEAKLPMNQLITITDDDVDRERHSRSRLRVGTVLTRSEALHLALMSSENRAAHALGRTFPGGIDAFAAAMNRKAVALGMLHTHYVEPTGLSNRNQSTARDLALLAIAAAKDPVIREDTTTPQHDAQLGRRLVRFNNSDRLVKSPRWNIALQKTGYIVEAGECLIVDAKMGTRNLVLVLLDSADKFSRLDDAERIRHWATGEAYPPRRQGFIRRHLHNLRVHLRHRPAAA